eukprot:scaffold69937_cov31-Tisochrysis_lutea.AAC.2
MGAKPRPGAVKPPGVARGKGGVPASPIIYAAAAAVAASAALVYFVFFSSKIGTLHADNAEVLKAVFFSGEPWLVECGRSGSPVLYQAESSLPKGTRAAILDCDATLPSGKTTLERFKISPNKRGPTILMFANADRPVVAPTVAVRSGSDLAKWATRLSKSRTVTLSSPSEFDQHCTRRKWCALVLSAGARTPSSESTAITTLAKAHRAVRIVVLDTSKMTVSEEILGLAGGLPEPSVVQSTFVLVKQVDATEGGGGQTGEKRFAAKFIEEGVAGASNALTSALEGGQLPSGFQMLEAKPAVEMKSIPPSSPRAEAENTESGTRTLTDEELKTLRAERARLEEERLEQRRAQMEAEEAAAGNIVEELLEDDEDDSGMEAEEEVEVEEIE